MTAVDHTPGPSVTPNFDGNHFLLILRVTIYRTTTIFLLEVQWYTS